MNQIECAFLTWDWREEPDVKQLNSFLSEGYKFITPILDTGSDQKVWVLTKKKVDKTQVLRLWRYYRPDTCRDT